MTKNTHVEAAMFCRENGIRPRRENGRVLLDVPDGCKVPSWLVPALDTYKGNFVSLFPPKPAAPVPVGVSLRELMTREFIPRREFVPGILVQGVSLLASKAKIGKTWLTLNTGLALAYGGRAFGKIEVERVGVLLLSLEDGPQRLQDRFALLLDDNEPPDNLHIFTDWPRLDAGGGAQLDAYLSEHPDIKVIFIDTLAKIRPARRKGGDLYAEDYAIGEVLKAIAEAHGVAIILVYHTRKARADDPLDEIRDTMGLTGGVDNCIVLRRARGQADAELFVSGRDIAEEKGYALTWDAVTAQWIIAGDASEYAVSTARRQVLDALSGAAEGLTPTEAARKLGKPLSAVKKLMWTMSKDDTLTVTEGRYQRNGNRGNPVTVNPGALTEQGKPGEATVTSRLPNVELSNPESNRPENEESSNSNENDADGYRVTTVTEAVAGRGEPILLARQKIVEYRDLSAQIAPNVLHDWLARDGFAPEVIRAAVSQENARAAHAAD